jgi:FkbM family methyltransferase
MVKSLIKGILSLAGLKLSRIPRPVKVPKGTLPPYPYRTDNRRSVDFTLIAGTGVFVLEDHLHFRLPQEAKKHSVEEFVKQEKCWERVHLDRSLVHVVQYFVRNNMPLAVLDIGGHWGLFSFDVAKILRHLGARASIVCFEPGATTDLIRASVELNGFGDLITVRSEAVSNRTGPTLFYMRDQYSESNALVRRDTHDYAKLAHLVDVRQVLREHARASAFLIKIDTEGMEETIIRAAESEEKPGQTVYMLELSHDPRRQQQLAFLDYLSKRFVIYDMPTQRQIPPEQFPALVDDLKNRPAGFTDLLCFPIGHPLNEGFWKVRDF